MDNVHNPWRWWKQWLKEVVDSILDFFAATLQELAGTIILETFQCTDVRPVNEAIYGLNKVLLQLLQLDVLL